MEASKDLPPVFCFNCRSSALTIWRMKKLRAGLNSNPQVRRGTFYGSVKLWTSLVFWCRPLSTNQVVIPLYEIDFSVSIAQYSCTKKTARRISSDCQESNGLFGEDEYQSWFTVHKARQWLHGGCLPWTEPRLKTTLTKSKVLRGDIRPMV